MIFEGVVKQFVCGEVLRGRICPKCQRQFFICQHCDRGHVYCCRECSIRSRREKCRSYRRRHRTSLEGRLDHRDQQRYRRQRISIKEKTVGDHTSEGGIKSARVSAQTRIVAMVAALSSVGEEDSSDVQTRCDFCGRPGDFVRFGQAKGGCGAKRDCFRLRL